MEEGKGGEKSGQGDSREEVGTMGLVGHERTS